jgi:hypothetical protein
MLFRFVNRDCRLCDISCCQFLPAPASGAYTGVAALLSRRICSLLSPTESGRSRHERPPAATLCRRWTFDAGCNHMQALRRAQRCNWRSSSTRTSISVDGNVRDMPTRICFSYIESHVRTKSPGIELKSEVTHFAYVSIRLPADAGARRAPTTFPIGQDVGAASCETASSPLTSCRRAVPPSAQLA